MAAVTVDSSCLTWGKDTILGNRFYVLEIKKIWEASTERPAERRQRRGCQQGPRCWSLKVTSQRWSRTRQLDTGESSQTFWGALGLGWEGMQEMVGDSHLCHRDLSASWCVVNAKFYCCTALYFLHVQILTGNQQIMLHFTLLWFYFVNSIDFELLLLWK